MTLYNKISLHIDYETRETKSFIKYNGIKDAKVHIHKTSGLYDASNEHDACGVGMIVDIHGNKSHELVDSALKCWKT